MHVLDAINEKSIKIAACKTFIPYIFLKRLFSMKLTMNNNNMSEDVKTCFLNFFTMRNFCSLWIAWLKRIFDEFIENEGEFTKILLKFTRIFEICDEKITSNF